jgi:hypothetical protein
MLILILFYRYDRITAFPWIRYPKILLGESYDGRLGPNLPRGRSKSICGNIDVDDEGSEQNFEPLQSLHHRSVGYQSMQHELT